MKQPDNPHRRQTFVQFLDEIVSGDAYAGVVDTFRDGPRDISYEDTRWHSVEQVLAPFPAASNALRGFAFEAWDPEFGPFNACNLKAQYIPDEDFVNGGRAFVLFNLIASNWTHVSQVANQSAHWKK